MMKVPENFLGNFQSDGSDKEIRTTFPKSNVSDSSGPIDSDLSGRVFLGGMSSLAFSVFSPESQR
jgi:hypothetical protein